MIASAAGPPVIAADELLVAFGRALRHAGVGVTADRTAAFLQAACLAGAADRSALYWAGRGTLCASPDDHDVFDRVFDAWFCGAAPPRRGQQPPLRTVQQAALAAEASAQDGDGSLLRTVASAEEVLRHRDIAGLSAAERTSLARLFDGLSVRPPTRRSPRRREFARGEIDPRRTLRDQLRRAGEPGPLRYRRPARRLRRVIWLVDVSGSMEPYADALLRLAHRFARGHPRGVEVFTVGTRLTRVTPALRLRDPDEALRAAGATVPDWSGGTRLGETLRVFTDRWGQRGAARGAVVVVASDGWERGDPVQLGEQVERLRRLAHAVVWMNPHRGKVGYLPVQGGIAAALPHLDALVAGHSMAAFAELLELVADA